MPSREWTFRIRDILNAIASVQQYVDGMKFSDFIADRKTVDAVIRNLIVIGEAATHIPDKVCADNNVIPWRDMRAMRNFVVHEYFGVSDRILWDTVMNDLPLVIAPLESLLKNHVPEH